MNQDKAERLRQARTKAGYKSASEAAEAFGWGVAGYRHHENGTRGFGADVARKYARAFRVKAGWLLVMDGIDDGQPTDFKASEKLIVRGPVAAGVWREPTEDIGVMEIDTPPPVPNAQRFGVTVDGPSMDEFYEEGTVLDCISIFTNGVQPESGDHVIVERIKADGLRELTVKEFHKRDGKYYVRPRSKHPKFQEELEIGAPEIGFAGDEETRVIGFVVSVIPPRTLRLLDRLGKVRRA